MYPRDIPCQDTHVSHIDVADSDYSCTFAHLGNVNGSRLGFLDIAADDERVGTKVDQRPCLCATDVTSTTRYKNNTSPWNLLETMYRDLRNWMSPRTEDAIAPHRADELVRLLLRHAF